MSHSKGRSSEFKVNDYLTLRLEGEVTNIYVRGALFNQCKYLLFSISVDNIKKYDVVESIDEMEQKLDNGFNARDREGIDPYTEFWGHCSNLQTWFENDYNICILHRNLAFPLLRALTKAGDPMAKKVFKEEIFSRFLSGFLPVMEFLLRGGYLDYFEKQELDARYDQLNISKLIPQEGIMNSAFVDIIAKFVDHTVLMKILWSRRTK